MIKYLFCLMSLFLVSQIVLAKGSVSDMDFARNNVVIDNTFINYRPIKVDDGPNTVGRNRLEKN